MFTLLFALVAPIAADETPFVAPGSQLEKLWSEGEFTEGQDRSEFPVSTERKSI